MGIDDKPKPHDAAKQADETPRILGEAKPFDSTPGAKTFKAADGSPVSVQFDTNGSIVSASGTGADGVNRRFWASGVKAIYMEGTFGPLIFTLDTTEFYQNYKTISFIMDLASVRSIYYIKSSMVSDESGPNFQVFQVIGTVFWKKTQVQQFTRNVGGADLKQDLSSFFQGTLGKGALNPMVYFMWPLASALLSTLGKPSVGSSTGYSVFDALCKNIGNNYGDQVAFACAVPALLNICCFNNYPLTLSNLSAYVNGTIPNGLTFPPDDGPCTCTTYQPIFGTQPCGVNQPVCSHDGPPDQCTCDAYKPPPCVCEAYQPEGCTCDGDCACDGEIWSCHCEDDEFQCSSKCTWEYCGEVS
jgi:hypothetical protein